MIRKLGVLGLYLFAIAGGIFLATPMVDSAGGSLPIWVGYIGLGLMVLGIVFMAIAAGPWTRINKNGDHSAPLRIESSETKKEE